jgi:energy-coupling factor transport system ATP-binding protein
MVIKTENLSFSYSKEPILRKINLEIDKGEFVGVMGPVGCGKTTLLLTMNGAIPNLIRGNFEGVVKVFGVDTREKEVHELARRVGIVLQDPDSQIFSLRVRDEVSFALGNFGFPRNEIEKKVNDVLNWVGLSKFVDEDPNNLSQGQKQKLAIASVIVFDPEILLLDEPVASLDYDSSKKIYELLSEYNKKGRTIIVVEHDAELLSEYAGRVLVISRGRVELDGKPEDVLTNKRFPSFGLRPPCSVEISKRLGLRATASMEKLIKKLVR